MKISETEYKRALKQLENLRNKDEKGILNDVEWAFLIRMEDIIQEYETQKFRALQSKHGTQGWVSDVE